jgi:hypothetical protein
MPLREVNGRPSNSGTNSAGHLPSGGDFPDSEPKEMKLGEGESRGWPGGSSALRLLPRTRPKHVSIQQARWTSTPNHRKAVALGSSHLTEKWQRIAFLLALQQFRIRFQFQEARLSPSPFLYHHHEPHASGLGDWKRFIHARNSHVDPTLQRSARLTATYRMHKLITR